MKHEGHEGKAFRERPRPIGIGCTHWMNGIDGYSFWTDDETCKLNINTASDGAYWDVPRVFTKEDMAYGRFQPGTGDHSLRHAPGGHVASERADPP